MLPAQLPPLAELPKLPPPPTEKGAGGLKTEEGREADVRMEGDGAATTAQQEVQDGAAAA